jgi:hypothetical protein
MVVWGVGGSIPQCPDCSQSRVVVAETHYKCPAVSAWGRCLYRTTTPRFEPAVLPPDLADFSAAALATLTPQTQPRLFHALPPAVLPSPAHTVHTHALRHTHTHTHKPHTPPSVGRGLFARALTLGWGVRRTRRPKRRRVGRRGLPPKPLRLRPLSQTPPSLDTRSLPLLLWPATPPYLRRCKCTWPPCAPLHSCMQADRRGAPRPPPTCLGRPGCACVGRVTRTHTRS